MKKEEKREIYLKARARKKSVKEGIFASVKNTIADYYMSPFAIAINASNSVVSLLTSAIGIMGPLSQMAGSKLMEKYSRKRIMLKTTFIEALSWIPLIIVAILFYFQIITNMLPLIVLTTFSIYTLIMNLHHPAWFSWMGDIVDERKRGKYFSKRNLIIGFVSVVTAIVAAFFLENFKKNSMEMQGFIILFFIAMVTRFASSRLLRTQYEPELKFKKQKPFPFFNFFLNLNKNNFGRFTIYRSLLGLTSAISSPLLAVYLLRNLEFTYTKYMIIILGGTLVSLFALEIWGKFADKYGNYRAIVFSSILIPLIPILWILHVNTIYLIFIPSAISGIAWAGLHLGARNFIYDNATPQKRGKLVSYLNTVWGMGVAIGAGIGAFLIKFLQTETIAPIIVIFILSGIARAIVAAWWLPKIKEIKNKRKFNTSKAIKNIIFKQTKPTLIEEAHEIFSIKKYFYDR